jgi:hypothetical protein
MSEKLASSANEDDYSKNSKNQAPQLIQLQLDTGDEYTRYRQKFWQIWCGLFVHVYQLNINGICGTGFPGTRLRLHEPR